MKLTIFTVLSVSGAIDGTSSPDLEKRLLPLIQPESRLILDMRDVNFVSTIGCRLLKRASDRTKSLSGHLILLGLKAEVRDTLKTVGFLKFLQTSETLEAAREALG